MQFATQSETSSSLNIIFNYVNLIRNQREDAAQITGSLTLSKSIDINTNDFIADLAYLSLTQQTLEAILESNPDFNYLYSNYSQTYQEPISQFFRPAGSQSIINLLYGPDLDVSLNKLLEFIAFIGNFFFNLKEIGYKQSNESSG